VARDYKNSGRSASRRGSSAGPAWGQLLIGLGLGLLVAVGVHLHHSGQVRVVLPSEQGARPAQPPLVEAPAAGEPADNRPRFEFYKLLPEMEVVVPEAEQRRLRDQSPPPAASTPTPAPRSASPPAAAPSAPPSPARAGTRYLLQAGAFQNFTDADRMKAQLALMGVEASIQSVELSGGETWHRVRVGPFSEAGEVNRVRQRLQSNGIEAILLSVGS
jgi:cell division protein FtsN